uniref:Uncharacterized protein n=1 Tax=Cacopsylla melanoneura TaxID=428564 RepID=A0A8D8YAE8_9HEMI
MLDWFLDLKPRKTREHSYINGYTTLQIDFTSKLRKFNLKLPTKITSHFKQVFCRKPKETMFIINSQKSCSYFLNKKIKITNFVGTQKTIGNFQKISHFYKKQKKCVKNFSRIIYLLVAGACD